MLRRLLEALTGYGQCTHPAIYQKDGRWYCTECHQLRA